MREQVIVLFEIGALALGLASCSWGHPGAISGFEFISRDGGFRVVDYVRNHDFGEVTGPEANISVSFRDSLLLLAEPVSASRM